MTRSATPSAFHKSASGRTRAPNRVTARERQGGRANEHIAPSRARRKRRGKAALGVENDESEPEQADRMEGYERRQGHCGHRISHGGQSEIGPNERCDGQNDREAEGRRAQTRGTERARRAERQNKDKPCAEPEQNGGAAPRSFSHRQRQKTRNNRGADRQFSGG
jgi:hypothetical protein